MFIKRMNRNFVAESQMAAYRRIGNKTIAEIDEENDCFIASFVYLTLFVNDQVYAATEEINEILPKSKLYRDKVADYFRRLRKSVRSYNTVCGSYLGKAGGYVVADILANIEDEMKKDIDLIYYAISQALLRRDVTGDVNRVASKAILISILAQMSLLLIDEFGRRYRRLTLGDNSLKALSMDRQEFLSISLAEAILPRGLDMNLNDDEGISKAFEAFNNKLLFSGALNKAVTETGKTCSQT